MEHVKQTRGKPKTKDVKNNPSYFRDYYNQTKRKIRCECGHIINHFSKLKHLKSKKHFEIMNFINLQNNTSTLDVVPFIAE